MKRFLAGGALIGLLLPLLFWLGAVWGGNGLANGAMVLWPTSFWLMALDAAGPPSVSYIVEIWAMSVGANVVLYALVGLLIYGIRSLVRTGHIAWATSISSGGTILLAAWVVFAWHM
jgi:hypothetical protein